MRKWWLGLAAMLMLTAAPARAQMTTVTALVMDANGERYVNCEWSVVFVGQNTVPGAGPYQPAALLVGQQGGCDSSGNLTVTLADNVATIRPTPSQWNFSICSAPGYVPGGTFCRSNMLVTITGQTQNLTSFFQPLMPILPTGGGGGGGGYITDATPLGGLMKTGTTLGLQTTCVQGQYLGWTGIAWACTGGGGGINSGTLVTVNGTQAVPNQLNFTNTLLPPAGSSVVNFLMNGNTVGAYVTGAGGGGTGFTVNGVTPTGTVNFNNSLPIPPPFGLNVQWQMQSGQLSAAVVGNGNAGDCFRGNGQFVPCPTGGGGGATLPTTPQYDLFASTGAGGAQASGVFGGPPGFLKTDVLVATGDITSVGAPFPLPGNASVEYFPQGGYGLGATNGLAAYISHSANAGANGAGGLALAGDSSDNIIKIYVDCETAPSAGCDFKVPITVNGNGVGGGGGGITGVTSGGGLQITGTTVGMLTTCGTGQYLSWAGAWTCTTLNTGVTTINGNAGAFTFSGSGVSCSGTTCTFGGGSSGVNTGTVNVIPKYVSTTTVGPSLLTDNGTTLTYTGTGGIVAPSINITTGPLQFTSVTGALPALPGAGHNGLVSGPDGWYFSNNNAAWALMGTGGGGGGATLPTCGVVTPTNSCVLASNAAGTAAVDTGVRASGGFIQSGASIVTGTAATSPFTGANASQEWYAAGGVIGPSTNSVTVPNGAALFMGNSAGTGGATSNGGIVLGGNSASTPASKEVYVDCEHTGCGFHVPLTQTLSSAGGAIALSTLVPGCVAQSTPAAGPGGNLTIDSTNFPGGNFQIVANDTVLVELAIIGSLNSTTSPQFIVTSGGSTYTSMGFTAASGYSTTQLYHSAINGASPATSLLLTVPTTGGITGSKYVVCVAAYRNVGSIGTPQTYGIATNVSPSTFANFTTQTVNSVIFSAFSYGVNTTTSQGSTGTRLAGAATTTPSAAQGVICQLNAPTPGSQTACSLTVGTPVPFTVMGVELSPVSTGTPITAQIPHVLSSGAVTYSDTVSIPISALCSPITCPAGIYRLSYYANVSTACTPGTLTIHSQYTDSVGAKTVDLMSTAFAFSSTTVPSSGSRVFQNSGTASITYSTTSVACSPGPGGGTFWLTLEQLQ